MFLLCRRTDVIPETRVLINPQHIVAVLPISGAAKSRVYMDNGEAWEVEVPFRDAIAFFRDNEQVATIGFTEQRPARPPGDA